MLQPGDHAPEVELCDQHGRPFRLSALKGSRNAVLFFYPKANSAICTKEACAFRDRYADFAAHDTEVIGISTDGQEEQFRFAQQRQLPFTLLCDTEEQAARAFGVHRWMGLFKNRVTFVIDRNGVIAASIRGRFLADHHVEEALRALR